MKKGFSGANVTALASSVLKEGDNLGAQAALCCIMYPVTPRVIAASRTGYMMEKLIEPTEHFGRRMNDQNVGDMLALAVDILHLNVWRRKAVPAVDWDDAVVHLIAELHDRSPKSFDQSIQLVNRLHVDLDSWCMVHGDPTLSNMMFREDGSMAIIDPIWSCRVTNDTTVDLGKMLQSAIGWETLRLGWQYNMRPAVAIILERLPEEHHERAWFWCMVHCLRLMPYATKAGDVQAYTWGRRNAAMIYDVLINGRYKSKEAMCDTLST